MNTDSTHKENTIDTIGSRKLGLSCAECRRSKLKCDRTFPCQSCIRRGCPGICPDGTLAATKGNKVLMAQAQRLSEQVKSLNSKVRELEAALSQARSKQETHDTHPRLESNGARLEAVSEAIGSLSLGVDGQAKYHGESAGSEYFQDLLPQDEEKPHKRAAFLDLPHEIVTLMNAFPFGLKDCPYNKSIFIRYLPSKQRAVELASIYYASVAWMYNPVTSEDFSTAILAPIYGSDGYPTTDALHSHRLAVFFMIMANGNLYDSHPSAVAVAEQYYALARAALSVDSVLVEVTCATVQAIFLIFRFVYNASQADREERWLLTGLATRVGQTIGLQRDSVAWNLEPEEVQRRRRLFWELFTWENWSSLVHGRAGSLFIQHTDCKFPEDLEPFTDQATNETEMGFHAWKFRYSAECMCVSVEHVFSTKTPTYSALLDIDQTIRNYPIPKHLRCPDGTPGNDQFLWSSNAALALQQYCVLCVRDSNLLYIHRSYFAQAIREAPDNPLQHKYKPSVLATYRTACRLINGLKSLYPLCSSSADVWFFWSGIFSAIVVLGALVVESPGCGLAKEAMREMGTALPFFEEGSRTCRPPSTYNFLERLYKRASASYIAFKTGQDRAVASGTAEVDELEVIGGRKSVITTKSNPNSPSLPPPSSPSSLHQDSIDGSSSINQRCIAKMPLIESYQPMDHSDNMQKTQDYHMQDNTRNGFEERACPSEGKPIHRPMTAEQAPTRATPHSYMPNHQPMPMAHPGHHSHEHAVVRQQQSRAANTWHSQPSYSQPHSHLHHSYAQQTSYVAYPHAEPSHHPPPVTAPYEYQSQPPQEIQNQYEIWRNFMLGFGPVA